MAMLQINLSCSLLELRRVCGAEFQDVNKRRMRGCLAELAATFDPSAPAVNLNTRMWKGLTTVLIEIVFSGKGGNSGAEDVLSPSV